MPLRLRCLLPGPFLGGFFSASSASSFSLFSSAFFRLSSQKSQRDSRWGVVGYDLRAGGNVRRGSQRCVGRGARGAVPGLGSPGLGVPYPYGTGCGCGCGCGCGLAVLVGRTGRRAGG